MCVRTSNTTFVDIFSMAKVLFYRKNSIIRFLDDLCATFLLSVSAAILFLFACELRVCVWQFPSPLTPGHNIKMTNWIDPICIRIWSDCHGATIEWVNQKRNQPTQSWSEKRKPCSWVSLILNLYIYILSFSFRSCQRRVHLGAHRNLLSAEETEFRMNCENLGPSHYNFWGHSRRIHIMKNYPTSGYRKSRYKLLIYSVQKCGLVDRTVLSHLRACVCVCEWTAYMPRLMPAPIGAK